MKRFDAVPPLSKDDIDTLNQRVDDVEIALGGGGVLTLAPGTRTAPSLSFENQFDTGLHNNNDGSVRVASQGDTVAVFTNAENVLTSNNNTISTPSAFPLITPSPSLTLSIQSLDRNTSGLRLYNQFSTQTSGSIIQLSGNDTEVSNGQGGDINFFNSNTTPPTPGNSSLKARISAGDHAQDGGQLKMNPTEADNPAYSFLDDRTSGLYKTPGGEMGLVLQGVPAMRIYSGGLITQFDTALLAVGLQPAVNQPAGVPSLITMGGSASVSRWFRFRTGDSAGVNNRTGVIFSRFDANNFFNALDDDGSLNWWFAPNVLTVPITPSTLRLSQTGELSMDTVSAATTVNAGTTSVSSSLIDFTGTSSEITLSGVASIPKLVFNNSVLDVEINSTPVATYTPNFLIVHSSISANAGALRYRIGPSSGLGGDTNTDVYLQVDSTRILELTTASVKAHRSLLLTQSTSRIQHKDVASPSYIEFEDTQPRVTVALADQPSINIIPASITLGHPLILDTAYPSVTFQGSGNTGFGAPTLNVIDTLIDGTPRMQTNASGVTIYNTLRLPQGAGTYKILTCTNGLGDAVWADDILVEYKTTPPYISGFTLGTSNHVTTYRVFNNFITFSGSFEADFVGNSTNVFELDLLLWANITGKQYVSANGIVSTYTTVLKTVPPQGYIYQVTPLSVPQLVVHETNGDAHINSRVQFSGTIILQDI